MAGLVLLTPLRRVQDQGERRGPHLVEERAALGFGLGLGRTAARAGGGALAMTSGGDRLRDPDATRARTNDQVDPPGSWGTTARTTSLSARLAYNYRDLLCSTMGRISSASLVEL